MGRLGCARLRATARAVACAAALAAAGLDAAAAQETGGAAGIRGQVTSSTGEPLSAVDVFVEGSGRRALSNASGRFQILDLVPGTYVLVAERVGYATQREEVSLAPGEVTEVTLQLEDRAVSIPEMIVTATRDAKDLSEVAASVGVIGGSAIRETHPAHPADIMGQVPGVYVNVTGGEGHMTAIRQPLSTAALYLYLEDGVPTRSTGFFNHNALYEVNVPQADRIEVMKGPANAMYGSDAIGGVINVGTRAPSEDFTGELSVEAGGHGFQRYLGSLSGTSGSNGFRADLNVTLNDGWRAGTDYTRYSGTLRWDRSFGAGTSMKTILTYSQIDQNTAGSSAISRADYESNPEINYTPISFRDVLALRFSSELEKRAGAWSWSVTPFARINTMELLPNWSLTYDPTIYETDNWSIGALAEVRYEVPGTGANVTVGVDLDRSPGNRFERIVVPNRVGSVFESYEEGATIYDYDVTFHEIAPWVQAEYTPTDRLHLSAGLRADFLGYDYDNHLGVETTGSHRRPADASPTFRAFSPKLGVTLAAAERLDVYASFRRGFRAPSEGQLFRQGSAVNTVDLEPIIADSWELGLRGSVGNRFRYEVSTYYMTKKDDILDYRLPDGNTQSVNAGKTLHKGVEVGVGAELLDGLSADVSYSYAIHTYEDWRPDAVTDYSGNEMEFGPRQVGSARLTFAPPQLAGSALTLEWSRVGPYWMDAANTNEYEGHDLFHLRATYQVTERMEIFGRVSNLLDERYAESARYTPFRGQELAPGQPRTFYVGVRVR